ncbi:MAG TPA: GNAT family N-acetyltransferase [Anaerolineales bacterium]|nr:GNAT family N-acetyltransferase [Anaerolineales bacterium]
MTVITLPYQPPAHPHLRRFDLRRDLGPVADLIELCFSETLDEDGRRYIRHMRATARRSVLLSWAAMAQDQVSAPYSGFVWEDDGRVVGNLSHFAMPARGKKIYLIANVAVHPDYRKRGIARALTEAALTYSEEKKVDATWLHVREENDPAHHLYQSLGFIERTRRTTWIAHSVPDVAPVLVGPMVGHRRGEHWPQQAYWLDQVHPPALDWYLPFKRNTFRPGLMGFFHRLLEDTYLKQWAVTWQGQLLGTLTWQRTNGSTDRLWLATPPEYEDTAIPALLAYARWEFPARRKLSLEHPAGRGVEAFKTFGFTKEQTLIWMEHLA